MERQAAMEHLAATAGGDDRGPALLRGAATDWPAIHSWSLARLVRDHGGFRASVRVSACRTFTFCELRHRQVLRGVVEPPSWTADMTISEFASRVQARHPDALAGVRLYLQAPLNAALRSDVHLSCAPFSLLGDAGDHGIESAGTLSQAPRLWISPGGSVSPLHFDASPSFLTQVGACVCVCVCVCVCAPHVGGYFFVVSHTPSLSLSPPLSSLPHSCTETWCDLRLGSSHPNPKPLRRSAAKSASCSTLPPRSTRWYVVFSVRVRPFVSLAERSS